MASQTPGSYQSPPTTSILNDSYCVYWFLSPEVLIPLAFIPVFHSMFSPGCCEVIDRHLNAWIKHHEIEQAKYTAPSR